MSVDVYMCIFLKCLYTHIYTQFNEEQKHDFLWLYFIAELCSVIPCTSFEWSLCCGWGTYKGTLKCILICFQMYVYYYHWKTTLVFLLVGTSIGSLFLPTHMVFLGFFFFQKTCRNLSLQLLSICQNLVKIGQQVQKLQHKAGTGTNCSHRNKKKGHICFWYTL